MYHPYAFSQKVTRGRILKKGINQLEWRVGKQDPSQGRGPGHTQDDGERRTQTITPH